MFDLKQWAAERKMTQKQIAQMSGTSTQPISALMNDGHCLEVTIIKVCSGIGRPYRREEWEEHILKNKAPNRPQKRKIKLEYDQIRNYRDRRSMKALRQNLAIGETVRVQFQLRPLSKTGQRETRWENGTIIRIYENHVGVMVQLKTAHGTALSLLKSYMIDDVVKWKTNLEVKK